MNQKRGEENNLVSRHANFFLYPFLLLITEWFYFFRTLFLKRHL